MKILATVSYSFDWNKAWADSNTHHTKHSILEVDPDRFHRSLLESLHEVDGHIVFNKTQSPQPMFRDKKDGTSYQCGWIYRCSMEDNGTTFRGDAWVSIHGVLEDYPFDPIQL